MMRIQLTEHLCDFLTILWWLQGGLSAPLIFFDLKEKQVPIFLVLLFFAFLMFAAYLNLSRCEFLLKNLIVGLAVVGSWRKISKIIGQADVILLSGILIYFPLSWLPCFFLLCGTISLTFGIYWRYRYHENKFPFIPAILLSFWLQLYLEGRV